LQIDDAVMKRAPIIAIAVLGMTLDSTFFAPAEAQLLQAQTAPAPNNSGQAAASLASDLTFPDEAEPRPP
jgi:hypothetical protein